jgi:hypothetical protein
MDDTILETREGSSAMGSSILKKTGWIPVQAPVVSSMAVYRRIEMWRRRSGAGQLQQVKAFDRAAAELRIAANEERRAAMDCRAACRHLGPAGRERPQAALRS